MNEGTPSSQTHAALRELIRSLEETDAEFSEELGAEPGAVVDHFLAIASGETSGRVWVEMVRDVENGPSGSAVLRAWRERAGDIPA